jgi:hypothetical protein
LLIYQQAGIGALMLPIGMIVLIGSARRRNASSDAGGLSSSDFSSETLSSRPARSLSSAPAILGPVVQVGPAC